MTLNILRPKQNGRHFPNDIILNGFSWMKMYEFRLEFHWLKFVPKGPINNIPALVQIMAWHRSCDKPSSGPMMVRLLTHICVTGPRWVNAAKCYVYSWVSLSWWSNNPPWVASCSIEQVTRDGQFDHRFNNWLFRVYLFNDKIELPHCICQKHHVTRQ